MDQSGLVSGDNIDPFRLGVYVGSGIGGFPSTYREVEKMITSGPRWISPLYVPTMIPNIASGNISIRHHANGPCVPVVTACATATHSLGEAYRAIRHGYADAIISGGTESPLIPMAVAAFANAKALTGSDDPDYACLPFNANRSGFVLAEGAGVLDALPLGGGYAFCGYGNTCDGYHITAPHPDGVTQSRAIEDALQEANYKTGKDNLYINSHGTGTQMNDKCETRAFKLALGEEEARRAHISSTKSMTGHPLGAAGGFEAIAAVMALRDGIVPPTIHLDTPDPECDLNYTPNTAVETPLTIAISDSLGFGGHNACIAFRRIV